MKIRDVMRPGAFTICDTDCLGNAYSVMNRSRIRHLPVTSAGKLVGILSERDILATRAHIDDADWWRIPVSRAMKMPVQTAGPDDSLTEVAGRMALAKIGAMPVVERGKLLGLATVTDVLDGEVRSAMSPSPVTSVTVADVMTPYPLSVAPEDPLLAAATMMIERHVRHLPVVDSTSSLVGMLSERDVRTAIGDPVAFVETRCRSRAQYCVREVMTQPAIAVTFDRPLVEAAARFADDKLGALPVVDGFGALIGILSYVDALRVLTR